MIQRLFAVGLGLQGTARLVDHPRAHERLEQAVDDVDATIREIRRTIFALGPDAGGGDVQAEATRLVERARGTLKFRPELDFVGPVRSLVTGDLAADVLAALSEALSNVSRHAHSSHVRVSLRAGSEVTLVVEDDGVGLPDDFAEGGLANIRERAARREGTVDLESAPGTGTRLTWSVPLRDTAH
ncbi:sensor histidine kinase [Nocardioides alcanivorans]|uniref:sensor histidine kinase n=1 Tax=Nocardioides alcanivorans TaxID=2897352 RepID=UPI001F23CDDD|nr:ATP-binding protein [Nocardioides alcanivorans]